MKNLLLLLIVLLTAAITVEAQNTRLNVLVDSLKAGAPSGGDTTFVYNCEGKHKWVYVIYTDSGLTTAAGLTDTVQVYISARNDSSVWVQAAVYDPVEDVTTTTIANSGTTKAWLIYYPRPSWIKLVLANSGGGIVSGRRGTFVIRAINDF